MIYHVPFDILSCTLSEIFVCVKTMGIWKGEVLSADGDKLFELIHALFRYRAVAMMANK